MMTDEERIQRADPGDAGCWIDGHWGGYGIPRLIDIAVTYGYADAEVIDLASRYSDLSDNEFDSLMDADDEVVAWLNEYVAPEGYSFGWWEGEFFLMSDQWWAENPDSEPEDYQ